MKKQIVDNIVKLLDENVNGLYVVGSYRRGEEIIKDLDFVTKRDLNDVLYDINRIMNFDTIVIGPEYVRIQVYYTHQYSISIDEKIFQYMCLLIFLDNVVIPYPESILHGQYQKMR